MSTRCPATLSLGRMRSRSSNLPHERTSKSSPRLYSSKRNGWLHTLRSCCMRFDVFFCLSVPSASCCVSTWFSVCRYSTFWSDESSHFRMLSLASGSCITSPRSALSRLVMKGRSTACRHLMRNSFSSSTTSTSTSSPVLNGFVNHSSKSSFVSKTSGSRKFRSDHSSWISFCSGVPLRITRLLAWYPFLPVRHAKSLLSLFFRRCPSSTMM
mmetsp:Transcript_46499/g.113244  ORF Transcript_46499/g.113244 Transcript_46499/m.113244 type:complete len:212 (-) Transcript_46499:1045-1680(-)